MKTNHQPEQAELEDMEKDAVWELLDKAPTKQAGPMFSRNVMRAIRLEEDAAPATPWWKKVFSPKPVLAMGAAACCALAVTAIYSPSSTSTTTTTTASVEDSIQLDAELEQELEYLLQVELEDEFLEELAVTSSDETFLSADEIAALSVSL